MVNLVYKQIDSRIFTRHVLANLFYQLHNAVDIGPRVYGGFPVHFGSGGYVDQLPLCGIYGLRPPSRCGFLPAL